MRAICIDPRAEGSRPSGLERLAIPQAEVVTVTSLAAARTLLADGQGCALVLAAGHLPDQERDRFAEELSSMSPPVPLVLVGDHAAQGLDTAAEPEEPESEAARLRAIVDNAPYCIHEIDSSGRFISMNPAGLRMIGFTSERQIVGKSMLEGMPPVERERVEGLLASALRGTAVQFEFSTTTGRRLSSNFIPISGADGNVQQLVGITLDISEQARHEEDLRQARDFSQALVESAPVIILLLDGEGRIEYVNPHFEELAGHELSEVAGKVWFETFLPERDRDRIGQLFAKAADGVPTKGNVNPIVTRTGEERLIEWYDRAILSEDGERRRLLAIGLDVTERNQAEQAVKANEQRLRGILDGMFAYVSLYSSDGVLLETNQHMLDQWQLSREQMVGRKPWETERWANAPRAQEALKSAYERARRGETIRTDLTTRMTDGRLITTDSTLQPLFDAQGNVTGILSFAVDVSERTKAEEKLRESELRLREAQRIAGIGNWELELVRGELHWSDEIFRIFEIDKEQFGASYEAFLEGIHPDDRGAVDAAYTRSLKTREPYEILHRLRMADGRIKYVEEKCETFWDEDGNALRSVGTVQDVTERFLAGQALRQSEETAAALLNAYTDIAMLIDVDGTLLAANDAARRRLAGRGEQLLGRSLLDALPGAMVPARLEWAREVVSTKKALNRTDSYRGRVYDNRAYPILNDNGEVARIAVYVRDITEQREAEEALHLEHAAIESSINAIALAGLDGNLVYVNGSFLDLWGLNGIDEALGRPAVEFWRDPTQASSVVEALIGEGHWIGEMDGARADGTLFTAMVSAHMVVDRDGQPARMMASFVDISPIKAAEAVLRGVNARLEERVQKRTAQLEDANRELETFTYSVSHDLKAPLRSIDGYSRLLLEDHAGQLDEEGLQFLGNVRRATTQMGGLIDDLLAYSRLERRSVSSEPVDVRAIAEAVWHERVVAGSRVATLAFDLACDTMVADRDALTLALRNLLENAVKFMGDNPKPVVEVGGRDEGSNCLLWVRDNGIGFDMKFHDRIFDIFQRLHRAEDYPGTGIGLAIVRKAVERMGGRIWAESQPGVGTTFYIEVPR